MEFVCFEFAINSFFHFFPPRFLSKRRNKKKKKEIVVPTIFVFFHIFLIFFIISTWHILTILFPFTVVWLLIPSFIRIKQIRNFHWRKALINFPRQLGGIRRACSKFLKFFVRRIFIAKANDLGINIQHLRHTRCTYTSYAPFM